MYQFKTEKMETKILGKMVEDDVSYFYESDDSTPDFDYGDANENAKEMLRFDTGELLNLCLRVRVSYLGETATEYLGQCFVASRSRENDLLDLARDNEMLSMACADLEMVIQDKLQALNKAFNAGNDCHVTK